MRTFTKIRDLDIKILLKLEYEELILKSRINKYVYSLFMDKNMWRQKIAKDFPLRSKYIWYTEYLNLYKENPKQLYQIIARKSKIVHFTWEDFPELSEKIPLEDYAEGLSEEYLQLFTDQLTPKLNDLPLLRGDVIYFGWVGNYRNDGKLMWDGQQVVNLDFSLDDYGSIPRNFTFPEFPFDHFYQSIDHNCLIWIDPKYIEQIIKIFDEKTQKSFVKTLYETYTIIPGVVDKDEKYIPLTSEQFAKYVREYPFIDNTSASDISVDDGILVIARWFGNFEI